MGKKRYSSLPKRRRCISSSIEDLPEGILIKIISLLKGIEGVRTSILSRRWRHLWKHTSKLSLGYRNALPVAAASKIDSYTNSYKQLYGEEKVIIKKLTDNIDLILASHRGIGLDCLKITFPLDDEGEHAPLDRWVSFASTSRVKKFVLLLHGMNPGKPRYSFPCHLFSSERGCRLEVLYLSDCSLRAYQNFDGFKNLTKLRLVRVDATNGVMHNLLSKCLALQVLEIRWCHPLDAIEIPSSLCKLKILIIHTYFGMNKVESHSPSLSMLTYDDLLEERGAPLIFKDALFLQEAKLELPQCSWRAVFDQLPHALPYVKTMHLEVNWKVKVTDLPEKHCVFAYLKHLVLKNVPAKANIDASFLLKVAPLLEKLVVHVEDYGSNLKATI